MHAPASAVIPSDLLLLAYRQGIFPMADGRGDEEVYWVEPRERAILPLDGFHMSRSLRKRVANDYFHVTCNAAFAEIMRACAAPRADSKDTWISHRIAASYEALHKKGLAHSVECWRGDVLVGGLYGVAFDQVFCGESMFSRHANASKVALAWLVAMMRHAGYRLLDCQFMTDHLASLGAISISQAEYCDRLAKAQKPTAMTLPEAYSWFADGAGGEGAGDGEGSATGGGGREADAPPAGLPVDGSSSPGKRIAQSLIQTS